MPVFSFKLKRTGVTTGFLQPENPTIRKIENNKKQKIGFIKAK